MKYKIGDRVYWIDGKLKLTITRISAFTGKYSCVCAQGHNWNWFSSDELKPVVRINQ